MPNYEVKLPDGSVERFAGPEMSDADAYQHAVQVQAFRNGQIPSTWWGGFGKALGEDKPTTQALLSGAALATGAPAALAAVPLAARAIEYGTKKVTGQNPDLPSKSEVATDVGTGLVSAYGPGLISSATKGLAGATVAHQSPITGQWVKGVSGGGILPWAARTAGEAANAVMESPAGRLLTASQPGYLATGVGGAAGTAGAAATAEVIGKMRELVNAGDSPYTAAKKLAGGDQTQLQSLLSLWMRAK